MISIYVDYRIAPQMNIGFLLLNNHSGKGGLETVLQKTTENLKKENINSYIFFLYEPSFKEFLTKFEHTYSINYPNALKKCQFAMPRFMEKYLHRRYIQKNYHALFDRVKNANLDALVVLNLTKQFSNHYKLIKNIKELLNIPIISWSHSSISDTKPAVVKKIKSKIDLFDGHLAISNGIKTEIENLYQQKNIYLIYNPISPAEIIPRDPSKFIFIGRIDKNKRVPLLLETFQTLSGHWHLEIYGSSGSNEKDQEIIELIESLHLTSNVSFHGWTDNPWSKIKKAGVLVLNSELEGFSLVIAEAMMRGIPALSTNCPVGPAEIIQQNINGWLFDTDDMSQCQKIAQGIIDNKIELPEQKAIQKSVEKFNSTKVTNNFIHAVADIITKYKKGER